MPGSTDPQRKTALELGEPPSAAPSVEHGAASFPIHDTAGEAGALPAPADSASADGTVPPKAPTPAPRALPAKRAAKQTTASADATRAEAAVPYDKATLAQALNAAVQKAEQCDLWGRVTGTARLFVTFAPSGRVTDARLEGEPLESAAVARCILHQARAASLPPFQGPAFTVARKITLR
jgi:hypothetical protein